MKLNNLSAKKICRLISAGMVFSMLVITGIFGGIMQDTRIFIAGGTLTLCAFFWIFLLVLFFGKRLSHLTSNLCRTLDNMIDGNEELQKSNDSETLFARINHRLIRLYEIMQKNRHKIDMERQELQMLISDISHQVKTPVSNLQMVTDTLLTKPVSEEERMQELDWYIICTFTRWYNKKHQRRKHMSRVGFVRNSIYEKGLKKMARA